MLLPKLWEKNIWKHQKTTEEWKKIAEKFYHRWSFPNRLGGVDGKPKQPKNSRSHYRNYKRSDSIILMGMIGPEYEFLFADGGMMVDILTVAIGPKVPQNLPLSLDH